MGDGAITEHFSEEELLEHILHFATEGEYGTENPYLSLLNTLYFAKIGHVMPAITPLLKMPGCMQDMIVGVASTDRHFKVTLRWEKRCQLSGHAMLPPSICEVERVVEIVENITWKELQ